MDLQPALETFILKPKKKKKKPKSFTIQSILSHGDMYMSEKQSTDKQCSTLELKLSQSGFYDVVQFLQPQLG
jgi:hypothetical protein